MTRRGFMACCALGLRSTGRAQGGNRRRTRFLILITADGMRWQELFTGIDAQLMNDKNAGMGIARALRDHLWRSTPEERRSALMPFFWGTLAPQGVVLGNMSKRSSLRVTNPFHNSYPGYSELLTGRTQNNVIRGNDPIQNPTPSIFQFLKNRQRLPATQAAVFASWETFHYIAETKPDEIFINAGYEPSNLPAGSARVTELNKLQSEALYVEDSARHDAFTFGLAMEYLASLRPKLFYIAFDETDDWAHSKRYDRVLQSIQFLDEALRDLWSWVQNSPTYRGLTTLVVTCDHGRGGTKENWSTHGADIPGAEQIWLAVVGPDTPAKGELINSREHYQRDIAPTMLELLGVDYKEFSGVEGVPISEVLGGS